MFNHTTLRRWWLASVDSRLAFLRTSCPCWHVSIGFAQMMYGRLYLNINLFKELARCFKRNIVLILAEKNGKVRLTRQTRAYSVHRTVGH